MFNEKLLQKFYTSFASANVEEMVSCYHPNCVFKDPAFGELKGEAVKNMWRMLINRSGGKLKITFNNVKANDKTGSANWQADYIYSQTGRKVINKITAQFEFEDGKIIKHTDSFNLWIWTQQALGWKGYFFGWTSWMKTKIQKQANRALQSYQTK